MNSFIATSRMISVSELMTLLAMINPTYKIVAKNVDKLVVIDDIGTTVGQIDFYTKRYERFYYDK
jgi:hypothetical protein